MSKQSKYKSYNYADSKISNVVSRKYDVRKRWLVGSNMRMQVIHESEENTKEYLLRSYYVVYLGLQTEKYGDFSRGKADVADKK